MFVSVQLILKVVEFQYYEVRSVFFFHVDSTVTDGDKFTSGVDYAATEFFNEFSLDIVFVRYLYKVHKMSA